MKSLPLSQQQGGTTNNVLMAIWRLSRFAAFRLFILLLILGGISFETYAQRFKGTITGTKSSTTEEIEVYYEVIKADPVTGEYTCKLCNNNYPGGTAYYYTQITIPDYVRYNNNDYLVTVLEGEEDGSGYYGPIPTGTYTAKVNLPLYLEEIGQSVFSHDNESLNEVSGSLNLKIIRKWAFRLARYLNTIDLSNVEEIGDYAFYGTRSLNEAYLPNIKELGREAFRTTQSDGLHKVTLGDELTKIPNRCFMGQTKLETVTLGSSIIEIGDSAFYSCNTLTSVTVGFSTPPIITSNTFSNRANATLYVPYGSKGAYEGANYWKQFKQIIEMAPETVPATNITLNKSSLTLTSSGQTSTLVATVTPSNATNKNVTWASSNTNVATVSSTGVVTAVANGTAVITATTADGTNLSAQCSVTVSIPVPTTGISLNNTTLTLTAAGQTATLTATVTPSNATNKNVTWTSSNTNVATVSNTGVVTAVANGTAVITATTADGTNQSAQCTVTVGIPVPASGISLNNATLTLTAAGQTATLTATVTPSNATNKNVTWASSNTAVATVSSTGVVTAVANGTAVITATTADGTNLSAQCTVTVKEEENIEVTDISQMDNVIYINKVEARAGTTATLSVKMKNSFLVEGFGFDLVLPEGVTVALDDYGDPMAELSTERTNSSITNHFDVDFKLDGSLNIQAYSTKGRTISGYDGEVALITIIVSEDMPAGKYPIVLKNIAISDENSTTMTVESVTSLLEVPAYKIGDANNDGNVNVGDLTAISHYILERPDASFLFQAADANQDGNVNVGDLTAVSHLILWGSIVRPQESAPRVSNIIDPQ